MFPPAGTAAPFGIILSGTPAAKKPKGRCVMATVEDELRELLIDAWCMVVSKKTAASYLDSQGIGRH